MESEYKIKEFPSVRKVWISGTTPAVSLPREMREANGLTKDILKKYDVWTEVIFTNKIQLKEKREDNKDLLPLPEEE